MLFLENLIQKYPRTYYSSAFILVPHLILNILICLAFGSLIAFLETDAEQEKNDLVLAKVNLETNVRDLANAQIEEGPEYCAQKFLAGNNIDVENTTSSVSIDVVEMLESLKQCGSDLEENHGMTRDFFEDEVPYYLDLTYGFTECPYKAVIPKEKRYKNKRFNYLDYATQKWNESFSELKQQYIDEGINEDEASEFARNEASGHEGCTMNYIGGAMFFFTVLTTIGYGNFVPQTTEARIVVFICGFFSILWFTATSAMAGTIVITLFDDWATRHDYQSLTRGLPSVLLWFAAFVCSMLACAAFANRYTIEELENEMSYEDSLWFSYITFTTVGFGDYSFPQHDFNLGWFFLIYCFILCGFISLATFLMKLQEFVASKVKSEDQKALLFVDKLEEYLKNN